MYYLYHVLITLCTNYKIYNTYIMQVIISLCTNDIMKPTNYTMTMQFTNDTMN